MKHDVRMRGFSERVDVEVVEAFLAERSGPLAEESVPLLESVGRVLAEDVRAEVDVPGFPRSAMDGYAVRGQESFGASTYDAIRLEVVGVSLPGSPFEASLDRGQAVRIMTGAPLPDGADAVVKAIESGETGRLYVCLYERDHQIYTHAPVEGLGGVG